MKACPVCLVECTDDYEYCPMDGIALLPFVLVDGEPELHGEDARARRLEGAAGAASAAPC